MPGVIVVGASRGLGLGLARAYAGNGWRVHATTRTPEAPGALGAVAGDVTFHGLDVTDGGGIAALAAALEEEAIDLAIHNAGVYGTGMRRAEVMRVNAEAPIAVVEALLPALARGAGRRAAILTSQTGARRGGPTPSGAYGASKAALNDRFRASEPGWRKRGVVSVVLHPGWVRTDMGGRGAPLSVEDSVDGMRRVLAGLTEADSGRFLTWQGREHPW